jgi:hypothetical protein
MESRTYRTEEIPYTRTTHQDKGQQSSKLCISSRLASHRGSRAYFRVVPKPDEESSSARRRTETLKESIRLRDPGSETCLWLGKKQTARDGRVSETYCRDRLARVNGSRAGKKARTRSKIPWVPKR